MHHLPASLLPPLAWTDQWRHSQGAGVSHMVSLCSQALSLAVSEFSLHIKSSLVMKNSRRLIYSDYFMSHWISVAKSHCAVIEANMLAPTESYNQVSHSCDTHSHMCLCSSSPPWMAIFLVSSLISVCLIGCLNATTSCFSVSSQCQRRVLSHTVSICLNECVYALFVFLEPNFYLNLNML